MSSDGWFKLHREIFDSDIWNDVTTFRLFIFLIGKASHMDGLKYKGMTLNKGQYVRSYRKLADDLSYKEGRGFKKYSLSTIKSSVQKLIDAERVSVEETDIGTLFTIINYEKYQDDLTHFNTLNTPETTNVNRTEVRTLKEVEKYNNNNSLNDYENRSPNGINEEVRTNSELMPNEVRTKSEQDQELKNLRIKEYISTTTTAIDEQSKKFGMLIKLFDENICPLSPMQIESLSKWFNDFNHDDEIIIEAIKISADRNKKSYGFVEYLLRDWANNNLKNIDQVRTYERNKFPKPNQNFRSRKTIRNEKLPDWFVKQKEEEQSVQTFTDQEDNFDFEAEKRRLEERFKKHQEA